MKFAIIVAVLLSVAFLTGLLLMLFSRKQSPPSAQVPVTQEYTLEGAPAVPTGTIAATILGTITITGAIPAGSTVNVEAKQVGSQQFSTVLQNLPAKSNQTFSYTKATKGMSYDMIVNLLDPTSKVIGTSQTLTVSAPWLNAQFNLSSVAPTASPTPTPIHTTPPAQTNSTPTSTLSTVIPTPTSTPTPTITTLSGNISFHGAAPINSRIVLLQKLSNGANYQVGLDNLSPIDGTLWKWGSAISGDSYSVTAVLKQKQSDGSDTDIASAAPVTVTAPAAFIVLTVNSYYTLTKPTGTSSVTCQTYNGGPNQNYWNVTVNFPSYTNAQSYWLEVGSTDGGNDIVNTNGNTLSVSSIFNNNTTYFARYAYAAEPGVDTGSGQYSAFSDTTKLLCGK